MSKHNPTQEKWLKNNIISTITMLASKLHSYEYVQAYYTYDSLYKCEYSNLESVRDRLLNEYNESVKNNQSKMVW
jgi:hypothetical protein